MMDKETDLPRYSIRLSLLGSLITCIIAYHLYVNAFGELREMDGLAVIGILIMSAPFTLTYIFSAALAIPYFLRDIYRGVNHKKSIVYTAATLAIPFVLLGFPSDFWPVAFGISGSLFLWSLLTVAITHPRIQKRKVRIF
jgi:hypothetical protein